MDLSEEQQRKNRGWANLKPYPPGVSGNPGGRPKGSKSITAIIRRLLDEGMDGEDIAEQLAVAALKQAKAGNLGFWKEIIDRTDGKPEDKYDDIAKRIADDLRNRPPVAAPPPPGAAPPGDGPPEVQGDPGGPEEREDHA